MKPALRSRLLTRGLIPLAAAAMVFGVRYDAWGYGGNRDKNGEGMLVNGAHGLPDLNRGRQAASEGRLQDAEADLKPLAERGYADAQISLANLYAHAGTPERVQAAIGWLRIARVSRPLDTEVPLGRLLARQNDDASLAEGEALLSTAWTQRKDADALAGLIGLYSEHPELDEDHRVDALVAQAEQIRLPNVQGAVIGWYRSTRGVGDHAEKLASLCTRWVDQVPECYVDLGRNARVAGDQDYLKTLVDAASKKYDDGIVTPDTLASLARVLVAPLTSIDANDDDDADQPAPAVKVSDVTEDEGEISDAALQTHPSQQLTPQSCMRIDLTAADPASTATGGTPAAAANAPAASGPAAQPDLANALLNKLLKGPDDSPVLAAGVVTRFPYLLPGTDIEAPLKTGAEHGDPQAKLYLGQLYLVGSRATRDPKLALRYLQQAAAAPETALKGHYALGRLYAYGYLDESQPLIAAQYLMWSARRGYAAADGALARMFVNGKGMCPNLTNAYVFARLGARDGSASTARLEQQIAAQLPAAQVAQADAMYTAELEARPSAYQIPKTMLAQAGIDDSSDDEANAAPIAAPAAAVSASVPEPVVARVPEAPVPDADANAVESAPVNAAPEIAIAPERMAGPEVQEMSEPAIAAEAEAATPPAALAPAAVASATPPDTQSDVAPPAPRHEIQLSHNPLSDPAVRRLLDGPSTATADTPPSTTTLEYTETLQQPTAAQHADPSTHSSDPS